MRKISTIPYAAFSVSKLWGEDTILFDDIESFFKALPPNVSTEQLYDIALEDRSDEKYLSDAISLDDIKMNCLNLIKAPAGSGKTRCALTRFPEITGNRMKSVYLIDSRYGSEQILTNEGTKAYSPEWMDLVAGEVLFEHDNIVVMTYAKFGTLRKFKPDFLKHISMIICDELHNIFWSIGVEKQKFRDDHLIMTDADILETLPRSCPNYIAFQTIKGLVTEGKCYVVAMTATPNRVYGNFSDITINTIQPIAPLKHLRNRKEESYHDFRQLLSRFKKGDKVLLYTPRITTMEYLCALAREAGFCAVAIWSDTNADHPMNQQQKDVLHHVIYGQEIPLEVDILIINKSCETSININTPVQYVCIHGGDDDAAIQARSRARCDIDILFKYNREPSLEDFPEEFLYVPLDNAMRDRLAEVLNIRNQNGRLKKWTSIHKLLEGKGYLIEETRINNKRFFRIYPPIAEVA